MGEALLRQAEPARTVQYHGQALRHAVELRTQGPPIQAKWVWTKTEYGEKWESVPDDTEQSWSGRGHGLTDTPGSETTEKQHSLAEEILNARAKRGIWPIPLPSWSQKERKELGTAFALDSGKRPAMEWADIAKAHPGLVDQVDCVAEFARIRDWPLASLVSLAGMYGANAGQCNAAQWAGLAAVVSVTQGAAQVAALARIAWTNFAAVRSLAYAIVNKGYDASVLAVLAAVVAEMLVRQS